MKLDAIKEKLLAIQNNTDASKILPELIPHINKLTSNELLYLFKKYYFPLPRHTGFVDLISKINSDDNAIILLNLIERLEPDNLKYLIYGRIIYTNGREDVDNLMRQIRRFSPPVVAKTLKIISKLTPWYMKDLLCGSGEEDCFNPMTPLEIPFLISNRFRPIEQAELAIAFIDTLSQNEAFQTILTNKPRTNAEPFLHQLVHHKNLPAIAHYLQHPELKIHHTGSNGQTALDIAYKLDYSEVLSLFKARPLYQYLLHPDKRSKQKIALLFETTITYFPGVLTTRWQDQKTLAHLAIESGNAVALESLLNHGADANAEDTKQLSLLDYAITGNQSDTLTTLISCPRTTLADIKKDGNLALPQLLARGDFAVVNSIITNLRRNFGLKEARSFTTALMLLPKARLTTDALKQALKKTCITTSRLLKLTEFCSETNDALTFFLIQIGELTATGQHLTITQATQNFIKDLLTRLANSDSMLEKETMRLQAIMLLFAMPANALTVFLRSLTLNAEQHVQLDITLCHALVQPLIFTSLNQSEHQHILEQLHDQQVSRNAIANVHFQSSDLTLLPVELLHQFSKEMPKETLIQHSKNRLNPAIIVLALSEELSGDVQNGEILTPLFASLEKELERFNQNKSSHALDELRMMLNLATHQNLQDVIMRFLKEQPADAEIWKKIDTLFTQYRSSQPLVHDGLLRHLFGILVKKPNYIADISKQAAVTDLVTQASVDEIHEILHNQHESIAPHLLIASLLGSANTDDSNQKQLPHDLYQLENQTARIALTPLVGAAGALGTAIRGVMTTLDESKYPQLKQPLIRLIATLEQMADTLIASQFDNTTHAWSPALNEAETALINSAQNVVHELEKNTPDTWKKHPQNDVAAKLLTILQEQILVAFPAMLKASFQKMELAYTSKANVIEKIVAEETPLHPLQCLFTEDMSLHDTTAITHAKDVQLQTLKERIKRFNDSIQKGILNHAASNDLLPALTDWQMSNGQWVTETNLITQIPVLLTKTTLATQETISKQQDAVLYHAEQASVLLTELHRLADTDTTIDALIDALFATDNETLGQFIALTAKAHVHDVHRISQYVLHGKQQHWDIASLKNRSWVQTRVSPMLQNSLSALSTFTATALSVKALIAGLYLDDEQCENRLHDFSEVLKTHKQPLTCEAIVLFATSHSALLDRDLFSNGAQRFVRAFSELIQQQPAHVQANVFTSLEPTLLHSLLEHVLSGVASPDAARAASNKALLTRLCQHAAHGGESQLNMIKKRLGAQDMTLLGDDCLKSLAKDVLTEKSGLDDLTYDGIWIQRLLVSPRFVSACPPETLQSLVERYRALSLTLKQDEFERLNDFIAGKLGFADQHRDALQRWQQELLSNPEARQRLVAKRERLLLFRADDSIRALYNQLEDNCFELRQTEPVLANKALDTLYTHHNQQLASMRSDILFRVADFVYSRTLKQKGDLPKHQNPLLAWLEQHMPHHNFQQAELKRKSSVQLFNETGVAIGYLDESNHARALENDQPVSLLEVTGWHAGSALYDENRQRLGTLTATGQLKQENVFQQHTSALLVSKMPISELEQSPAALELLIQDICNENALSMLFESIEDQEKRAWIEHHVSKHIQENKSTLPAELIANFVVHHPIDSLLNALSNSANTSNAERLLSAIFADDTKRHDLLAMDETPELAAFLKQGNADELLANFLRDHHKKPWFEEGLLLFTKSMPNQGLLERSLEILKTRVGTHTLSNTLLDTILHALLKTPAVAKIVRKEGSDISRFFNKTHLMPVIKQLNLRDSWHDAQYPLILTILNNEHARLFPGIERRDGDACVTWNSEDIQDLTAFASKHVRIGTQFDKNGEIGHRLLSELVFRCANYGQTALFYQKDGFLDANITRTHLKRSTLDALASRYYLVNYAKETIEEMIATIKKWFGSTDEHDTLLDDELKNNEAIIDWKAIAKGAWSHTDNCELPLIAAFLINYNGANEPILRLIEDVLKNPDVMKQRDIVHHLAQIMGLYPHRDVSQVIFNALMDGCRQNPQLIDQAVFDNLAIFHARAHLSCKGVLQPLDAELSLLTHFGQQKNYALTQHVARLLYKPNSWTNFFRRLVGAEVTKNEEINALFGRALTEATVERELQRNTDRWYFRMQKTLKRWWNYGTSGVQNPSGAVKFCDDESDYTESWLTPKCITTLIPGGKAINFDFNYLEDSAQTQTRYRLFMNKIALPQKTPPVSSVPLEPSFIEKLGFFAEAKKILDIPLPNVISMAVM